ncbi:MAG: hypothetical protein OK449_01055 [Thaumarchaeota archaeon]|nr:hypothetical protein [Nitrososphaerota archaeon]
MVTRRRKTLANSERGRVFVYIWFDIEDYVTEESDSLPLVALSILDKYGARATCKMVAEKVRILLERNRVDVISAIASHDVGYHLDTHSRHPVVYEYLADLDTLKGAREFAKKERQGLELVEKTFGKSSSCFGHPGPAWGPHYYPAMREMGIPVYLDETPILNLNNQPYWYCGVLNLNGANENFVKFDYTFESPTGLSKLKKQFEEVHQRLAERGGGSVSFLFHLHTAINKEFWDAVNFGHGRNRTKEEYVRPPSQPPEVTERAWRNFDEMIGFMSEFEDVRFITASDALEIFRQTRPSYDRRLVESVLKELGSDVRYVKVMDDFASPSELFYLIVRCISTISRTGKLPARVRTKEPLGPAASVSPTSPRRIEVKELIAASHRLVAEIDSTERLPSSVVLGNGAELSTVDFMMTSARILESMLAGSPLPKETRVVRAAFLQSKFVDPEAFQLACRWTVLPPGFTAPRILEEITLQTWTLRPAVVQAPATSS